MITLRMMRLPILLIILLPLMGLSQEKEGKREFFDPSVKVEDSGKLVQELREEVR